jgi:hypothetical protein
MIFNIDAANIKSYSYQENLIPYSNNFATTGSWVVQAAVTIIPNAAYAPDGTLTASSYSLNAPSGRGVQQYPTLVAGQTYTFSIFVKPIVDTTVLLRVNTTATTIDVNTPVTVSAGWTRLSSTFVTDANFQSVQFQDVSGNTGTLFYCWGAQLQKSPWLEKYTPTVGTTNTASYTIVDLSGNGKNGSLNTVNPINFPVYSSTSSGAIMFAGTDTYIRTASLGTMTQYTFSFWARRDAESRMAVSTGNGQYYWYGDNSWRWGHGAVGGEHYYTKNISIPLGSWGYYAATYDGITVSVYRQGILQGAVTTSTSVVDLTSGLTIGWWGNNNYAWLGPISMVTIYNKALSASEISQNFDAYRDRYGI